MLYKYTKRDNILKTYANILLHTYYTYTLKNKNTGYKNYASSINKRYN